ncbi:MAG: 1-acyl-sn-glycerol-3-phosphate acyltransferase [Oceanospirillaceae bacterium]|nr:1-acyl-sn-glycerol-3-phosphate acyltransferase [Oceanospirillaceae bacterium]MBT13592.1 1-acyl-sn-glycerol-3-phosphate acyltransferase [Oceanospirillaceae bacterium]|tara:strand:+ start:16864 stop:17592 length:729 start_codon:yes stop_codon:yes gene_type:complete
MLFAFRSLYLTGHFLIVCCFALLFCLVRPLHRDNTFFLAGLMSWSLPVLGIRLKRLNQSPVGNGAAVYIVNHQDVLDVFICTGMLPRNIAILGKTELRYIPVFGLAFWLAGNLYINRKNKAKAWDTMQSMAKIVKHRQRAVYIFPEGTRSKGQGMLPFKSGAFALAIEAGLPIVPIVFSSTHKNIDLHKWHAGYAAGKFLDPISTDGMGEEDVRRLADECREKMIKAVAEVDDEVAALDRNR